jgi:hypothetical protein
MLGGHGVEQGRVVYFAGENPDDIRMRLIGANVDLDTRISLIPGIFDIEALRERLVEEITRVGPIDLVVIDTSAAYFLGEDENSNPQMGAHARMLRKLTTLPGGPCVLVLCHPRPSASCLFAYSTGRHGGVWIGYRGRDLKAKRWRVHLREAFALVGCPGPRRTEHACPRPVIHVRPH